VKLNEDGSNYLNLYDLEVECPACGTRQEIYEIPVNRSTIDDHECIECDAQIEFHVHVHVDVDGKVKASSE
jgi:hypothetical protein